MTPLTMILGGVGLVLVAALVTAWLVRRHAAALLDQRLAAAEARHERDRRESRDRQLIDRRAADAVRAEADLLRLSVELARAESDTAKRELARAEAAASSATSARDVLVAAAQADADNRVATAARDAAAEVARLTRDAATRLAAADAARAEAEAARQRDVGTFAARLADSQARQVAELASERALSAAAVAAAETRATAEIQQWRSRAAMFAATCQVDLDRPGLAPLYPDRPAPNELEEVVQRVRGLSFVDAVTISDRAGLPVGRGDGRDVDDLAAVVPAVTRAAAACRAILGPVAGVTIATNDARTVELRALPAWTGGAWLVAQAAAQRPPPAALDAAVGFAYQRRGGGFELGTRPALTTRARLGSTGPRATALADELDRATATLRCQAVAIVRGPGVLTGVLVDGPTADQLSRLAEVLSVLHRASRAALRADDLASLSIDLAWGAHVAVAPLSVTAQLSLLTLHHGAPLEPLAIQRVTGRLRRFLDDAGATQAEGAA